MAAFTAAIGVVGVVLLKNKKFLIGGVVVLGAIAFLGFNALAGATSYYYQVGELLGKGSSVYSHTVRVRGTVVVGSMDRQIGQQATLKFVLADPANAQTMPVIYRGAVPDTFKEGGDVVCEGKLGADGTFQATTLMPNCPSKYVPG